MKYFMIFILGTIVVVSTFLFVVRDTKSCRIPSGGAFWSFELAKTLPEQMRGLMGRTKLCEKCGMLFVFDTPGAQGFWMKDTLIPLDMYFYDSEGMLVDRALNMRPDTEVSPPMQYVSQKLVGYVIEVAQGSGFYARKLDFNHCNLR